MGNQSKFSLNQQILLAAALGLVLGLALQFLGPQGPLASKILYFCDLAGTIFVKLLKMILIPLVFTSIAVGISNLKAHAQMDKVWKLALIYFMSTTAFAVFTGLMVVNIFTPGRGLEIELFADAMHSFNHEGMKLSEFVHSLLTGLFVNPIAAMAKNAVLPTVIFALFCGIALIVSKDKLKHTQGLLNELFELVMVIVNWIMRVAPIGIFALLTKLVATQDGQLLKQLGVFIAVVVGGTLFHGIVTLPTLLKVFGKVSPAKFFRGMEKALLTAFSTSSSSATLPITMECVEENLKVDKNVAGFVLPLGATMNMDGTALYEAIAALFIANTMGIELSIVQQLIVFLMAIVAAIGAPGIPSAGMVTMIMVLQSVGLPVEGIAILLPIDRLLDSLRTTVNVEGDAVGSCIVHQRLQNNH